MQNRGKQIYFPAEPVPDSAKKRSCGDRKTGRVPRRRKRKRRQAAGSPPHGGHHLKGKIEGSIPPRKSTRIRNRKNRGAKAPAPFHNRNKESGKINFRTIKGKQKGFRILIFVIRGKRKRRLKQQTNFNLNSREEGRAGGKSGSKLLIPLQFMHPRLRPKK